MTRAESNIVLFSITLCWASSYIFIKNIPQTVSTFAYLTMTTGIAGIIMVIVFFRKLKEFDKKTLWRSLLLSAAICGNLILERLGISRIPASTASFIASLNIVFVPLFLLIFKKKPSRNNIAGILLILTGLGFTSGIRPGEALDSGALAMTAACMFMAVYIILADRFTKKSEPLLLGMGQMFFTAAASFILWFLEEPKTFFAVEYTNALLANIFLLAFFAKAYAYIMLMYSQKYASPITVTVISSTEPVVTMALALLIPNSFGQTETLATAKLIGAALILAGAVFAGTDFLNRKRPGPGTLDKHMQEVR
jgi:drug/metabolite transporter (DMT)-like permease